MRASPLSHHYARNRGSHQLLSAVDGYREKELLLPSRDRSRIAGLLSPTRVRGPRRAVRIQNSAPYGDPKDEP